MRNAIVPEVIKAWEFRKARLQLKGKAAARDSQAYLSGAMAALELQQTPDAPQERVKRPYTRKTDAPKRGPGRPRTKDVHAS